MEDQIKSQLTAGCKSHKVRLKGLGDHKVTLPKLLEYGRTLELTDEHAKHIEAAVTVNRIQKQPHRGGQHPRQRSYGNNNNRSKQTNAANSRPSNS